MGNDLKHPGVLAGCSMPVENDFPKRDRPIKNLLFLLRCIC
jgi:hypothetical protein